MTNTVNIPTNMLPEDGRFGSGPSKIRPEQVQALDAGARHLLGTSHRQTPVKQVVGSIREGLSNFFQIPDGYEVVLGNGGASAFWDIACASLITRKAAFGTYGSFSAKFAKSAQSAPFLEDPEIFAGKPGTYRLPELTEYVDAYCWAHNETSTGVAAPVKRVEGSKEQGALTLIDATSGAGALNVDISQTDAYYFSPQKAFGSDGGLWIAMLSPAAIDRAYGIAKSVSLPGARRWIPPFLSLTSAIENSRKDQTLNTPAVATLVMLENQVRGRGDNAMSWVGLATAAVFDSGAVRTELTTDDGAINWKYVAVQAVGAAIVGDRMGEDAGLNYLGNAIGAWLGGVVIDAGWSLQSIPLVAAGITLAALALTVYTARLDRPPVASRTQLVECEAG